MGQKTGLDGEHISLLHLILFPISLWASLPILGSPPPIVGSWIQTFEIGRKGIIWGEAGQTPGYSREWSRAPAPEQADEGVGGRRSHESGRMLVKMEGKRKKGATEDEMVR